MGVWILLKGLGLAPSDFKGAGLWSHVEVD